MFGLIIRAAEKGNFEAAVKLGIAYLYNEGRKFINVSLNLSVVNYICSIVELSFIVSSNKLI